MEVWSSDDEGDDDSDTEHRPTSLFMAALEESISANADADSSPAKTGTLPRSRSSSLDGFPPPAGSAEDLYMQPETALASLREEHQYEDAYMSPESLDLHNASEV